MAADLRLAPAAGTAINKTTGIDEASGSTAPGG